MELRLKTPEDIEILAEGGRILRTVLEDVAALVRPGITGKELDTKAEAALHMHGANPSFKGYNPSGRRSNAFPASLCVSINSAVVHGIPDATPFQEGDVIGLDIGCVYKGLYTDTAMTVVAGSPSRDARLLIEVTRNALAAGIDAVRPENTVGDIGAAIQSVVEHAGLSVVRDLVGHGVGYAVHEEPSVPNVGKPGRGTVLREGMVIALEPMVTKGDYAVTVASDGWTVITTNGKQAAHEEHTVAVVSGGSRVLTVADHG